MNNRAKKICVIVFGSLIATTILLALAIVITYICIIDPQNPDSKYAGFMFAITLPFFVVFMLAECIAAFCATYLIAHKGKTILGTITSALFLLLSVGVMVYILYELGIPIILDFFDDIFSPRYSELVLIY